MSKTRFVAFATQKGGIGKSTITALVANYFHNVKGYNVAVIDCDEPQYNLADLRDEELELIKSSDYFKAQACEHFKKLGKKSFSVTRSNAVNALDDAETVLNETEVKLDFIFFDMMQRYYFLLENMYRAMMIFWLTCLVGYPRTSAPEPLFQGTSL